MAVFLRKEPEWNQGESEGGRGGDDGSGGNSAGGADGAQTDGAVDNSEGVTEGGVENSVQQTYPEVITSLDEIHEVGTLAQVRLPVSALPEGTIMVYQVRQSRLECDVCVQLVVSLSGIMDAYN